jgi:hypothetical protein
MKNKKTHEIIDRQLAALFGDPVSADTSELDDICQASAEHANLVQKLYELAQRAAQQSRLAGKPVPSHVAAVIAQLKPTNTLEGVSSSTLSQLVDSALKPFRGPAHNLAINYHRLKEKSEHDERVLEDLADEVKQDWSEEDEQ